MANLNEVCSVHLLVLLVCALISVFVPVNASVESTTTLQFDVKPGGDVHTFTGGIREYECSFTYASQGGTNEQWLMSTGLSDDDKLFSCSVWRPQGNSYLFFTQFKLELKGIKIEYANAYSQTSAVGSDVPLKSEELTIGDSMVSHTNGKFNSKISKVTAVGRIKHDEL